MSDAAITQQIFQAVEYAKTRARQAESAFDRSNSDIQRKASRSIDIFGGSAGSTVADIARDARRACDDLYTAYQSLIITLDESCRPLLNQDPEAIAVKAVADLIKKLNDDSEIESNFTASLNGNSLGDVAGSRYVPSMNCKMIQRYWEDRYATWPGRAEQEAAARQKAEEQRRQAEAAANKEYEAKMEQYAKQMEQYERELQEHKKAYAQWEATAADIKKTRASEVQKRLAEFERKRNAELQEAYTKRKKEARRQQQDLEKERAEAQQTLASAGFFAFSVKKAAKKKIAVTSAALSALSYTMHQIELDHGDQIHALDQEKKDYKRRVSDEIERKHKIPSAPVAPSKPIQPTKPRPAVTRSVPVQSVSSYGMDSVKQAILDSMMPGEKYTVTDIIMTCPEAADMTNQRVAALLRQLVSSGDVIRTEDERKAYFELP